MSGATVTVKNLNSGYTRDVQTGDDGYYIIPLLPVGNYELRVEKEGFSMLVQSSSTGGSLTVERLPTSRPATHFGRITLFQSNANSICHGLAANLDKRFSRHFQGSISYAFSKAIDDKPDSTSVVPGNAGGDPNNDVNSFTDRVPGFPRNTVTLPRQVSMDIVGARLSRLRASEGYFPVRSIQSVQPAELSRRQPERRPGFDSL